MKNDVPYWLREFAAETEKLRRKNEQMAEETAKIREETAKIREQNIKLREQNIKLGELYVSRLIQNSIKPQYLDLFESFFNDLI